MNLGLAFVAGVIAGLRVFTAPTVVSWAARLGALHLEGTWLSFLGALWTPWAFTVLAAAELVVDQLPGTASRTVPAQFGARLVSGGFCGGAIGVSGGSWIVGLVAGVIGAVVGTYGGSAARGRLAAALGTDRPAAFIEDAVAIMLGVLVVVAVG